MIMKYVFLIFVILQLFVTSTAIADTDFDTIREHARYVLREVPDDQSGISIYMYAADEKDELCGDNIGGLCVYENDHKISGHYKLFVVQDADTSSASILSSTDVGEKSFRATSPYNLQPKFLKMPGVNDKLISIIEDARPSIGRPYTSLFRIDDKNKISPVKFLLKDGKEFTDSGDLSVKNKKLIMDISYNEAPPDEEYLKSLPGKFDWKTLTQTLTFTYKDGNFYEADK